MKVHRHYSLTLVDNHTSFHDAEQRRALETLRWRGLPVFGIELRMEPSVFRGAGQVSFSSHYDVVDVNLGPLSVDGSMIMFVPTDRLIASKLSPIVVALASGELRGAYEEQLAHQVFWTLLVEEPGGLCALAGVFRPAAEFYAVNAWLGRPLPCHPDAGSVITKPSHERLHKQCSVCGSDAFEERATWIEQALRPAPPTP